MIEVADAVIRIMAAAGADGGGWHDFDTAVRAQVPEGRQLPADWYRLVADQDRRARTVLNQAAVSARYRETPVTDLAAPHELLAGQLVDCFAPVEQRLRAAATRVLQGSAAEMAVRPAGWAGSRSPGRSSLTSRVRIRSSWPRTPPREAPCFSPAALCAWPRRLRCRRWRYRHTG